MSLITFGVEQHGNIDEDKVKVLAKQAATQVWNNNVLNQAQMTSYKDVRETEAVPESKHNFTSPSTMQYFKTTISALDSRVVSGGAGQGDFTLIMNIDDMVSQKQSGLMNRQAKGKMSKGKNGKGKMGRKGKSGKSRPEGKQGGTMCRRCYLFHRENRGL